MNNPTHLPGFGVTATERQRNHNFMRTLIIYLLFVLPAILANAQSMSLKPINRLSLYVGEQYYFDKKSVRNDGKLPENILFPNNTFGKQISLEYERSKHHLLYGGGLIYGKRNYSLLIKNDLSNFDPNAVNSLKNYYRQNQEHGSVNYTGVKLSIGYNKKISSTWTLIGKINPELRLLLTGSRAASHSYLIYNDDNLRQRNQEIHSVINLYGRDPYDKSQPSFKRLIRSPSYLILNTYIAVQYTKPPVKWLKSVSLGLETGKRISFGWDYDVMIVQSRQSINITPNNLAAMSRDVFIDRCFYMGLRAGVSLWH